MVLVQDHLQRTLATFSLLKGFLGTCMGKYAMKTSYNHQIVHSPLVNTMKAHKAVQQRKKVQLEKACKKGPVQR